MWSSIIRKCSKIMFLCQNAINSYHWHYIIIINRSLFCVGHFCPSFFLRFQGTQLKSRSFKQYRNSSSFLILYLCLPNCCRCRRLLLHPITLKDTHTVRRSPLDEYSARRAVTSTWQPTTLAGNRTLIHPAGCEPTIPASERPQTHAFRTRGNGNWLYYNYTAEYIFGTL